MKLRFRDTKQVVYGSEFNVSAPNEVIVHSEDFGATSAFLSELDVFIPEMGWKPFRDALKDYDIITDNYNRRFFIPSTLEDRERGFTL